MSEPLRQPVEVEPPQTRHPVDVAVGILIAADGRFLMTSRPEGKVCAGQWEFPGGKLEAGETVEDALRRELVEEIGVVIGPVEPWRIEIVDYPHARVRLHFCKVREWRGALEMREAQQASWQTLPVTVAPVLVGTLPVLDWFAEERGYIGSRVAGGGDGGEPSSSLSSSRGGATSTR